MARYILSILILMAVLIGCGAEVPLHKRDKEFARRDLELERQKYKTFAGSKEREAIDRQIEDHNSEWHIEPYEERHSPAMKEDADRIREFNKILDQKIRAAQQPVQKE